MLEFDDKKRVNSGVYLEIEKMLEELNRFLTVYQSDFRRWFAFYERKHVDSYISLSEFQRDYPRFDSLLRDFVELNESMRQHAEYFGIDILDWEYKIDLEIVRGMETNDIK